MQVLIGKEVCVHLTSGYSLEGSLSEILPESLVLKNHAGRVGIIATSNITMILEMPYDDEDDEGGTEEVKGESP